MSRSRFRICAWTDTSSAVTGSSAMTNLGTGRDRAGDTNPLPLSPAEPRQQLGQMADVEADQVDQLPDPSVDLLRLGKTMDLKRLGDSLPHGDARVERRVGDLEDHLGINTGRHAAHELEASSGRPPVRSRPTSRHGRPSARLARGEFDPAWSCPNRSRRPARASHPGRS